MTSLENYILKISTKAKSEAETEQKNMLNFLQRKNVAVTAFKIKKINEIKQNINRGNGKINASEIKSVDDVIIKSVDDVIWNDLFKMITTCYSIGTLIYGSKKDVSESEINEWVNNVNEIINKFCRFYKPYTKETNEKTQTTSSFLCFGSKNVTNHIPQIEYYERVSNLIENSLKKDRQEIYDMAVKILDKLADKLEIAHSDIQYPTAEKVYQDAKKQANKEILDLISSKLFTRYELVERVQKTKEITSQ